MSLDYSRIEKRAVVKVLKDVMYSDGYADRSELNFFGKVVEALTMSKFDLDEALILDVDSSIQVLQKMSHSKRKQLGELIMVMATVDGRVEPEELAICQAINIAVDIPN